MRTEGWRRLRGTVEWVGLLLLATCLAAGAQPRRDRSGYTPAPLPEEIVQAARQRSAEPTRTNENALNQLCACLSLEQRQSLLWHLLVAQAAPLNDGQWQTLAPLYASLDVDVGPVLEEVLYAGEASARLRACGLAGSVGFRQQGPNPLAKPLVPVVCALVERALGQDSEEERAAALEALAQFHAHPTPWAHQIASLLTDPSRRIRRQAAWTLAQSGPVAATYAERMLDLFDVRGNPDDADRAAWIMDEMGWVPPTVGPHLIARIGKTRDPDDVPPLNYPLEWMPASPEIADALLSLPPAHLRDQEVCYWIRQHAQGDRRFISPLLLALEEDWRDDSGGPDCSYTSSLAEALVAVGRDAPGLAQRLLAMLEKPIPPDARLRVGWALSKITGDPEHLVGALVWVLERNQQRAASYTGDRTIELLGDVDPTVADRLAPYQDTLAALVRGFKYGDPTGYWMLTGDVQTVLAWARADLDKTYQSGVCSSALDEAIGKLGPLAGPLTDRLLRLLRESDDWDRAGVCEAVAALGPAPVTRSLRPELLALADRFQAAWRVEPALALWSCCRDTNAALAILMPLLDDQGWATTSACRALGQMGQDAETALPALRRLAMGPNPAYAAAAREAAALIEAEVRRTPRLDVLWEELGSDDPLQSIRTLWRLSDHSEDVLRWLEQRIAYDDAPILPGRRMRRHARARQVLVIRGRKGGLQGGDDFWHE